MNDLVLHEIVNRIAVSRDAKSAADFASWWFKVGGGMIPCEGEDPAEQTARVAGVAWVAGVAAAESELRKERDEARREICGKESADLWNIPPEKTPEQIAQERGWDCFEFEEDGK